MFKSSSGFRIWGKKEFLESYYLKYSDCNWNFSKMKLHFSLGISLAYETTGKFKKTQECKKKRGFCAISRCRCHVAKQTRDKVINE